MARALVALTAAILMAGCGLVSKDFEVSQDFQAGGRPSFTGSVDSATLIGPISGDVSKISSITLKAARIEATDGKDVSLVSDAIISISDPHNLLPTALLARLNAPAPAGATSVDLTVTGKELKPYLQASGTIAAGIGFSPTPVTARALKLVLTLHGTLF